MITSPASFEFPRCTSIVFVTHSLLVHSDFYSHHSNLETFGPLAIVSIPELEAGHGASIIEGRAGERIVNAENSEVVNICDERTKRRKQWGMCRGRSAALRAG